MRSHTALATLQAETERKLGRVGRWKTFAGADGPLDSGRTSGRSRRQSVLGHSVTIVQTALRVILAETRAGKEIDERAILSCLALHDGGEACRADAGNDIEKPRKRRGHELQEVHTYLTSLVPLPLHEALDLRWRYLMQYAHDPDCLGPTFAVELRALRERYPFEADLIRLIEDYDYILYALCELVEQGHLQIFIHTLRGSHAKIKAMLDTCTGFAAELYTPDFIAFCDALLTMYDGVPEQEIPVDISPDHVEALHDLEIPNDFPLRISAAQKEDAHGRNGSTVPAPVPLVAAT